MDLEKIKKQWRDYSNEFATSDFMDIENHTSMALQVGSLITEIERLQKLDRIAEDFIRDDQETKERYGNEIKELISLNLWAARRLKSFQHDYVYRELEKITGQSIRSILKINETKE